MASSSRTDSAPGSDPAPEGPSTSRLTVLSGPSGVGKDSVLTAVRARYPQVWVSVSVTTRPPRPGEREGAPYHFVDGQEFARMVAEHELLEHAEYAGYYYGTPRRPALAHLAAGVHALLKIDIQGARQVRAALPSARLVFLAPPSWNELERRLRGRGTEDPEVLRRRLDRARVELAAADEFDAVIVNERVEDAAQRLVALMMIP